MSKRVFTTYQAASYCNVTPATIIRWVNEGLIRSYKTAGGHRRIVADDLDAFLKKTGIPADGRYDELMNRVLVVDDEKFVVEYIKEAIKRIDSNIQVKGAYSGFEAGQIISTFKPHVVFLDIIMKEIDGYDVCVRIKEHPETSHIRVIAITGYPSKENIERIKKCGAYDVLNKPIHVNDIRRVLIDLLPLGAGEPEDKQEI